MRKDPSKYSIAGIGQNTMKSPGCCIAMNTIHTHIHAGTKRRHNKDERHSSLEKYTTHFIWKGSKGFRKVLLCERWVYRLSRNGNILTPNSYGHKQCFFPVLLGCSTGGQASLGRGPHSSIFSPTGLNSNLLNFLWTELFNCWTTTFSLWASHIALNSTRLRSRLYPDIPRPDSPVIYTGAFPILTAWPGSICYIETWGDLLSFKFLWKTIS